MLWQLKLELIVGWLQRCISVFNIKVLWYSYSALIMRLSFLILFCIVSFCVFWGRCWGNMCWQILHIKKEKHLRLETLLIASRSWISSAFLATGLKHLMFLSALCYLAKATSFFPLIPKSASKIILSCMWNCEWV